MAAAAELFSQPTWELKAIAKLDKTTSLRFPAIKIKASLGNSALNFKLKCMERVFLGACIFFLSC